MAHAGYKIILILIIEILIINTGIRDSHLVFAQIFIWWEHIGEQKYSWFTVPFRI